MPEASNASLTRSLLAALLIPVTLLIAVGVLLGLQVQRLSNDAEWVDHSDTVIAKTFELQKQVVDQETGLRGFLVTGEPRFLEPYIAARPRDMLTELAQLVSDQPDQTARVVEVRRRYDAWFEAASPATTPEHLAVGRTVEAMNSRKDLMDAVRKAVAELLVAEQNLRYARAASLSSSNRTTRYALVGLIAFTALAVGLISRRSLANIARTFGQALDKEQQARAAIEREQWLRTGQMKIAEIAQGNLLVDEVADRVLKEFARYVDAEVGAVFVGDPTGWKRAAGFALDPASSGATAFARGEGLVGRAALAAAPTIVKDVPEGFLKVRSGVGAAEPRELLLSAATTEGTTYAVIELGFFRAIEPRVVELSSRVGESVAMAVRAAEYKARLRELLEESQRQAEELQTQQEELRVANEELQEQSNALREANDQVEQRQAELEATNQSLEEQTNALRRAQQALVDKATEVERASRYKSEFLANMSHELRTPLNSSLILAKLLSDNPKGNLNEEQVRFAETIYSAGNDLLTLINDVLDLSKIEAGKVDVHASNAPVSSIIEPITRSFSPMAKSKGIGLVIELDPKLPATMTTDVQRVQQILKNLLSNAIKFTEEGSVSLRVEPRDGEVVFAVTDTGIGIKADEQDIIFEAFRQADGTTNRKYGGTGLGLSISRDLAALLGGSLVVESTAGKGSTFTLTLPVAYQAPPKTDDDEPRFSAVPPVARPRRVRPLEQRAPNVAPGPLASVASTTTAALDDRARIDRHHRLLLIVEDDLAFARILIDLAHELDFQAIHADTADEGLRLATEHVPDAVILDMNLPDHSGLTVLDRLKRRPATRHVPVHVVSVADYQQQALSMGAIGYMFKPVAREQLVDALKGMEARFTTRMRRLLVVEDDKVARESICLLLAGDDVETVAVGTVREALESLRSSTFDCVVADLTLPDKSGYELLETMAHDDAYPFPPVIIYTGRSLTEDEEQRLRKYSSSIIVKGARSPERLLDEATLFLHRVESDLPPERQRMLEQARDRERVFDGRNILVVEDDVRNIFALSSLLEPKGAKVLIARNGREGIEALEKHPEVDLVLMDIMMPEMDGLTAMREIRKRGKWAKLPILSLTAKAMRDDQERCLQAGANDYVSKPIDVETLLSLLRVWMPPERRA